jgi:hypothetical protein
MSYVPANLNLKDATSLVWAIAWTRFFLRDTVTPFQLEDSEITAVLEATAFTVEGTSYYRPQIAASNIITSDPERALSESLLGVNVRSRDPEEVARAIRVDNRWVDSLIALESGQYPETGRTLTAVF